MKLKSMIKTALLLLCLLGGVNSAWADFKDFSVIVNNQNGTLLTSDEQVQELFLYLCSQNLANQIERY